MKIERSYELVIFCDWFYPASKAGGPISSVQNLVEQMGKYHPILVVTSDRDLGDKEPFKNIDTGVVQDYSKQVDVIYGIFTKKDYLSILQQVSPKSIYLNSMFSIPFSFLPLRAAKVYKKAKVVLAPRGMLNTNALKIKRAKKQLFLQAFKLLGLHKLVHFHATDENESKRIKSTFGQDATVISNFPYPVGEHNPIRKEANTLRLVSSARVSPEKNVKAIFNYLHEISPKFQIEFTLIGHLEKKDYWEECLSLIEKLPEHVAVNVLGALPKKQALELMSQCDVFILPTLGENFGHSIYESFTLSKPVIISNLTPWRELEKQGIGFDLSLDTPAKFVTSIEKFAAMDDQTYQGWSKAAYDFASTFEKKNEMVPEYNQLFDLN
jgi:glycosyltransferase involved in cell wall biosynthesis